METGIFASSPGLYLTCQARLNGDLPSIPLAPDNPLLSTYWRTQEASRMEVSVSGHGMIVATDEDLDMAPFIEHLKEAGIEVENLSIEICG